MGFFSLDSSQWELQKCLQPIFSISYRFRVKRGQRGQKRHFEVLIKFLFFIQFWWDFFHWIPLNESFKNAYSRFFLSLTVFELKGAKGANIAILRCSIALDFEASKMLIKFLFFIQFWWDFFHWIPLNESFKNAYSRFFLFLTVFELKGAKIIENVFWRIYNIFEIFDCLFVGLCQTHYSVKHIIVSNIYYCVKNIIVSNKC